MHCLWLMKNQERDRKVDFLLMHKTLKWWYRPQDTLQILIAYTNDQQRHSSGWYIHGTAAVWALDDSICFCSSLWWRINKAAGKWVVVKKHKESHTELLYNSYIFRKGLHSGPRMRASVLQHNLMENRESHRKDAVLFTCYKASVMPSVIFLNVFQFLRMRPMYMCCNTLKFKERGSVHAWKILLTFFGFRKFSGIA